MFGLIMSKAEELAAYRSKNRELAEWLRKSNLWYWFYTMQRLKGEPLAKKDIVDILDGKILENVPMEVYPFAHNCAAIYKDMENSVEMNSNADIKLLRRWYSMLFEKDAEYRKDNPIVYEWELIPGHFSELPLETDNLFRRSYSARLSVDPIERACALHLGFIKLYPFGEDTMPMALLILMYSIMEAGLPLPLLTVNDREYNRLIADYVIDDDITPFREMLERSLLNRLDAALDVCGRLPGDDTDDI